MIESTSHALGTSLVFARLGGRATTPPNEQQLLERLQAAASDVGCRTPDLVTALYVGLKMHLRVCVCGAARSQTMALFDALVTTIVGSDSDQTLHLRGPIGSDAMAQRFAALRLSDFITTILEPEAQGKAWFLLIDTPGDPTTMLTWAEQEIAATLHALGRPRRALPANLFVLVAAGERPAAQPAQHGCWLALNAPHMDEQRAPRRIGGVPPVGYQRQLLDCQLTGATYRRRLRRVNTYLRRMHCTETRLSARWLAASIDRQGYGLWVPSDPSANAHKAIAVLRASGLA